MDGQLLVWYYLKKPRVLPRASGATILNGTSVDHATQESVTMPQWRVP